MLRQTLALGSPSDSSGSRSAKGERTDSADCLRSHSHSQGGQIAGSKCSPKPPTSCGSHGTLFMVFREEREEASMIRTPEGASSVDMFFFSTRLSSKLVNQIRVSRFCFHTSRRITEGKLLLITSIHLVKFK